MKNNLIPVGALTFLCALNSQFTTAFAQGTAFTYQGQLNDGGSPANGIYDLTFTLFSVSSGPGTVAGPLTNSAMGATDGVFTITLDFGVDVFTGADRWLEIGVRTNAGAFITLAPRQQIQPTPYAIYSAGAASAAAATSATNATTANNFSGSLAGDVTGIQGATVVGSVGGQTAANIASGVIAANAATNTNTINTIVKRDGSGGFIAGSLRILSTNNNGPNNILSGPTDNSRIVVSNSTSGMRFFDPSGFTFGSQITVNGPVFAQAFIQTSSRRFKNDVKPIEQPIEKISQLQGVRFTWNQEKGGRDDVGFIAEDVAKVIPELVSWEGDGQNACGVNYDHLIAVAIEGIKAQQTQIQTLKRENAELKQSMAELRALIAKPAVQQPERRE